MTTTIELIIERDELARTNVKIALKPAKMASYFMQAVAVLEDVADRFDILEGQDGFEWVSDLKFDIEEVLELEKKLSTEPINE